MKVLMKGQLWGVHPEDLLQREKRINSLTDK
jgi:hypothetical protein